MNGFRRYIKRRANKSNNLLYSIIYLFLISLTQPSFRLFWRKWNPIFGYPLMIVYKSLGGNKRYRSSLIITFLFSGFLIHDLLIFLVVGKLYLIFTVSFCIYAALIMAEEKFPNIFCFIYNPNEHALNILTNLCFIFSGVTIGFSICCFKLIFKT